MARVGTLAPLWCRDLCKFGACVRSKLALIFEKVCTVRSGYAFPAACWPGLSHQHQLFWSQRLVLVVLDWSGVGVVVVV